MKKKKKRKKKDQHSRRRISRYVAKLINASGEQVGMQHVGWFLARKVCQPEAAQGRLYVVARKRYFIIVMDVRVYVARVYFRWNEGRTHRHLVAIFKPYPYEYATFEHSSRVHEISTV